MFEKRRVNREAHGSDPQGLPDIFATPDQAAGAATVSHGPYAEQLPVDGMTVEQVRHRFGDRLDIDPESIPILDGHQTNEGTVVRAGQVLLFTRRAGEKGAVGEPAHH
jgi:hypothetical protein